MRTPPNERLTSDIADPPKARKASEPERRCILSGETAPREMLVRLVASPAGLVLPDAQEKAPGRGAWIGVTRDELTEAQAKGKLKGALARAFKTGELEVPENLPQIVENALTRVLLDRLGLEMRVGSLILGTQRIAEAARGGDVALLLHARDASEDGRKKLDQAWRVGREAEGSGERGLELPLDRNALSVALGRDNVVHLAVAGSGADDAAAARVMKPMTRLKHYLGQA
ncbi:DUF448 domain-containing protein [Qipengyuania mesophila]|uniref:DUF448 domain-containing protein n=1 Tax=Qipengyuania mesophila TaxID=2867246 RepID=UPI0035120CC2